MSLYQNKNKWRFIEITPANNGHVLRTDLLRPLYVIGRGVLAVLSERESSKNAAYILLLYCTQKFL